jgi:hypothetical protein
MLPRTMSAALAFDFSVSPFTASLAAFDPSVHVTDLQQVRAIPYNVDTRPLQFVVLFRHAPTPRVFAYDLQTNTWSDATSLFPWALQPVIMYTSHQATYDDFVAPRLR